jgi:hypothetical protein
MATARARCPVKVFHFTSPHRLEPVLRQGLTLGLTPVVADSKVIRIPGYQWLTRDPAFHQSWNESSLLPYDRTAYRIEIAIPRSCRGNLYPWPQWRAELGERMLPGLDRHGDPENWLIFKGAIPPDWFRRIAANPSPATCGSGRRDVLTLETKKIRLLHLCEWFVRENNITSVTAISPSDDLAEKAAVLIGQMCSIIGYAAPHGPEHALSGDFASRNRVTLPSGGLA